MSEWQEKSDLYKKRLKELDKWVKSNWGELPEGVKHILCRGENEYRDSIKRYEEWAKEETEAE